MMHKCSSQWSTPAAGKLTWAAVEGGAEAAAAAAVAGAFSAEVAPWVGVA